MMLNLVLLFAVTLLSDSAKTLDAVASDRTDGARRNVSFGAGKRGETARISSVSADFDRRECVAMFEENVSIDYAGSYIMHADRLFVFLTSSNELSRVVAIGNVSVTNEARNGTCAMATYRRKMREIEMFGDGNGVPARLSEGGRMASELEGSRIRFWLDSEQVEVEDSRIGIERREEGGGALP